MSSKKFDLGVLLYSTDYSYEGSKHFLGVGISHAERLKAVAKKPIVATIDSKDWSNKVGIQHIPLKIPMQKYLKHILFLIKSFIKMGAIVRKNKGKTKVLVARSFMAGTIVSLVSRIFGGSSVVYYQYDWVNWKSGLIDRIAAKIVQRPSVRYSDLLIATTPSLKATLVSMGAGPSKVKVVPNHVETDTFKNTNKSSARKGLGMDQKEKSMFFAGRFEHQKNLFTLLEALTRMKDVKLYLAGDGSQKEELEKYAEENNISGRVVFLGKIPQDKLVKYINACNIFVLPSFYEGHPKALIEAMACRTPIVASRADGNVDVIKNKRNGLLFDPGSPEELSEAVQRLLKDREFSERLALKAEEDASKYSKERILKKEKRIFSGLLESKT